MIDWGRVKDLRSEIGAEDFSDVVALFLEEADEVIARISASAGAKGLESDLHFLKGAALNLGFDALATVCQDGERRAAAGDVAIDLDRVRQVYTESKARFEYLKKSARNFGSVLIGIETKNAANFALLFAQLDAAAFTYRDITNDEILSEFLI